MKYAVLMKWDAAKYFAASLFSFFTLVCLKTHSRHLHLCLNIDSCCARGHGKAYSKLFVLESPL